MRTRRIRQVVLVAVLLVTSALILHAQIPRLPKMPKVPGTSTGPPPPSPSTPSGSSARLYCGSITSEMLDRFLKALAAEKAALAADLAAAKAQQQSADSSTERVAQQQMDAMMKLSECTDAAEAKDPRAKERDRLSGLSEDATAKGDDKLAEKYSDQASQLSDKVTKAALEVCAAEKAALDNVTRSGGASLDASEAAKRAMRDAEGNAAKTGARAGNFTDEEYAMLRECITGRLQRPAITPTSPASAAAIDARREELAKALDIK